MSKAHFPNRRSSRSRAEWISLAISSLIVILLIVLVIFHRVSAGDVPPQLSVRALTDQTRHIGDVYYLTVEVTNTGSKTAEAVKVQGESQNEVRDFEIDFLDGEESAKGVLIFRQDPRVSLVTVSVVSFREP